jgi:hypothetical protein
MLEEKIDKLTVAMTRVADLLEKNGGATTGAGTAATTSTGPKVTETKTSDADAAKVKGAAVLVRDALGGEGVDTDGVGAKAASALIAKHAGKGKKLTDLLGLPDKWPAFIKEAKAKAAALKAEAEAAASGDADDGAADPDDDLGGM